MSSGAKLRIGKASPVGKVAFTGKQTIPPATHKTLRSRHVGNQSVKLAEKQAELEEDRLIIAIFLN